MALVLEKKVFQKLHIILLRSKQHGEDKGGLSRYREVLVSLK